MKTTTPMIPHYCWCQFNLEIVSHVLKLELWIDCIIVDHMTYSNTEVSCTFPKSCDEFLCQASFILTFSKSSGGGMRRAAETVTVVPSKSVVNRAQG